MQGAQTRLRYNQQLLANGLNAGENAYLSGTTVGMQSRVAGNISEGIGQGMSFIPDFTVGGAGVAGSPVAISKLPLGSKLAQVFQAAARILNTVADVSNTNAGIGSTTGGWVRRADDWQHQVEVITIEMAQIKRQQLAAQRRRDIALRELNNHKVQMDNSAEVDAFVRDKISKQDLYLFMQQETAQLYRRTFDLAWQTAKEAEAALKHERRDLSSLVTASLPKELGPAGWDNLHSGLMAGERLDFALRSLEHMHLRETGCREYELSKHISLRLQFPLAFLQLKTLGWCEFELPEWLFDLDYPGHYLRRIKNVSVTIPCVVGPYVGVHCRLQLLSSGIRMEPTLPTETKCCCKKDAPCIGPLPPHRPSPCQDQTHAESQPVCVSAYADPNALTRDFLTTEAIATSSGQNDSGLFELSFRDEKLRAPFEFAGAAASRWRIELPARNNAFDLESLGDFVVHLNYTAREGGPMLREVADRAVSKRLPGDGVRFFDVRAEFPSAWRAAFDPAVLGGEVVAGTGRGRRENGHDRRREREERKEAKNKRASHQHHRGRPMQALRTFPLHFSRRSFPFVTGRKTVTISRLHVFVDTDKPGTIGGHFPITFMPHGGCKEDSKKFVCTSSCHTPAFFHGILADLSLGPLREDESPALPLGCLEFPEALAAAACVRRVYFLCYFEAGGEEEVC